MSKTLIWRK